MTQEFDQFAPPPLRPRWPWIGPDLQTIRDTLVARPRRDAAALAARPDFLRERIDLGDGDALSAAIDGPREPYRGTLIAIHGLTGCEGGAQIVGLAQAATAAGWRVIRLNLRGAGPSAAFCRQRYHAGRTGDLARAFAWARARYDGPLGAVGYSLGGATLLRHLGEGDTLLDFAASFCAPIDLAVAARWIARPRNWVYTRWLLNRMKAEARADAETLKTVTSLYDFDDRIVAPQNGFAGADDYYSRSSAAPVIGAIKIPTLIVAARDDPWIPFAPFQTMAPSPRIATVFPSSGGHVGFHAVGGRCDWRDQLVLDWLDAP